jgi:cytochrome c-type biogenesis protein
VDIGFVVAFLGGALALLSPCGALLLPAFFATTVTSGGRLVLHTGVFFVGLVTTLAPLGLGAGLLGVLFAEQRVVLVTVAGWLIVALGLVTALGLGFDLRRLLPAAGASRGGPRTSGLGRSFVMGTVAGVAGFCAGPILGAVLTMAAAGSPLVAAATMVVYGAGMVVPLLLLALVWQRLGRRGRAVLRGRPVVLGPVTTHTTSLVSGTLLIAVGVVFLRTNGMAALPELVPAATLSRAQSAVISIGSAVPDVVLITGAALVALVVWWSVDRRRPASSRHDR